MRFSPCAVLILFTQRGIRIPERSQDGYVDGRKKHVLRVLNWFSLSRTCKTKFPCSNKFQRIPPNKSEISNFLMSKKILQRKYQRPLLNWQSLTGDFLSKKTNHQTNAFYSMQHNIPSYQKAIVLCFSKSARSWQPISFPQHHNIS